MTIAMLSTVSPESSANSWNIGDSSFDSIVANAVSSMSATQSALVYALSQALENGNSNKLNELFASDLCTKPVVDSKWEQSLLSMSIENRLKMMENPKLVRKQIAQGATLLGYLRHHGILAQHVISETTGEKVYVDGPLTFSKGKFTFTKEDKDAGVMHWRSQLAIINGENGSLVWELDSLFTELMGELWYQYTKGKGVKRGLDLHKSLKSLAKRAAKAADDDENESIACMSEGMFLEAAKLAYRELMADSAK